MVEPAETPLPSQAHIFSRRDIGAPQTRCGGSAPPAISAGVGQRAHVPFRGGPKQTSCLLTNRKR